ncbi:MAG: UMP kinase [Candidatus Cloacimonetes bacterium]|nr:UMP kinase [Candidatus Cloacimonadota bacterium]
MQRILIKMSGEALGGSDGRGIEASLVSQLGEQIKALRENGTQIGIVVGGGNIFRGVQGKSKGMDPVMSDFMGMLATVINAVGLAELFRALGIPSVVTTPFALGQYVEQYNASRAREYLDEGKVVVFAGGTGNPFVTTDSAGALRAAEIGAELLIKATKVNGVYDGDPVQNPNARLYQEISFAQVIAQGLSVMDAGAIALCQQRSIPIRVLNIFEKNSIVDLLKGKNIGTLIH